MITNHHLLDHNKPTIRPYDLTLPSFPYGAWTIWSDLEREDFASVTFKKGRGLDKEGGVWIAVIKGGPFIFSFISLDYVPWFNFYLLRLHRDALFQRSLIIRIAQITIQGCKGEKDGPKLELWEGVTRVK